MPRASKAVASMQVIGCQLNIAWEDKAANHQRVRDLLARCDVRAGALIVLPEMFATGFSMNVAGVNEDDDGAPTERFCAELAREHAAHVLAGIVRRSPGTNERGLNQAVAFDPRGTEIARYTKTHPMTVAGEADHYVAGSDVATFTLEPFTVSPLICYDLRFPEVFRLAAARGAHLLAVIANWPAVRAAHWRALLVARAIENQAYVVGVNRTGPSPELDYVGGSLLVDPRGEVVAEADDDETTLVAELDFDALLAYREKFPALADRRWA